MPGEEEEEVTQGHLGLGCAQDGVKGGFTTKREREMCGEGRICAVKTKEAETYSSTKFGATKIWYYPFKYMKISILNEVVRCP